MLRLMERLLHELALCHLALAASALCVLLHWWVPVIVLWAIVGWGGCGAAWSVDTTDGGDPLGIAGALHRPSALVLRTVAEHAPFAVLSVGVLVWRLRR